MGLTKERLAQFVGGDLEIWDYEGRTLGDTGGIVRGPIENAEIDSSGLTVRLGWVARNDSFNARDPAGTWTIGHIRGRSTGDEYRTALDTFTEQKKAGPVHIYLNSSIQGVVLLFHPPGDNLKPSQVAGHPGAPPT